MELTKREVYIGVGALVVIVAAITFIYMRDGGTFGKLATSSGERVIPRKDVDVPAMTAVMQQVLERSSGFQLLVSYTDNGFEPAYASIKAGDTVRFTNNSAQELWVSAAAVNDANVYPGSGNTCGQSDFDSCVRLQPREFWEFTFDEAGTWGYQNLTATEDTATLDVK